MARVTIRWPAKLSSIGYGRAANRQVLADIFGSYAKEFAATIIAVEEPPEIRNHSAFMAACQPL